MRVLFVHREPSLASARVRVLGLVPHLRDRGVDCRLAEHPRDPLTLATLLSRSGSRADVVVLQKKLPSAAAGLAWRRCASPLVLDYDDAIWLRQQPRAGSHESRTRSRRFARACRLADAFTCGNEYLAAHCGAGRPRLVAPSPVPLEVPRAVAGARARPLRVGWIGSSGNLPELTALAPALRELAERRRFVLVVISEASVDLPGVPVEHVPWMLAHQESVLADLDVGLMPLADSPWSRGKCAYKLLQYMAAGLPVVASPVGMNARVVQEAENGFLATSSREWLLALEALYDDPALRARLGDAGRRRVEAEFGYATQAARWHAFLEQVAAAPTGRRFTGAAPGG